jgi:hypothetical protein
MTTFFSFYHTIFLPRGQHFLSNQQGFGGFYIHLTLYVAFQLLQSPIRQIIIDNNSN